MKKSNHYGKIHLSIDPKPPNQTLKRNYYPLPVMEDLLPDLAKAKVVTVVDAKNGFWHVPLDISSSYNLCCTVGIVLVKEDALWNFQCSAEMPVITKI